MQAILLVNFLEVNVAFLNVVFLIFSTLFAGYLITELSDYSTKNRGQNGFFLALSINSIITCIGKMA